MQRRKFNERCARDCSFEMNVIQLKRQSWNLAIILLALVLGLWRISQLPQFGAYEARTFVLGILPIALLSMGQAIIIIGGGINLAIGAEAVLINCLSAKYMQDTTFIESVILAIVFILVGMLIGALTGWIIAVSGIADIVVTLATSFLLVGVAMYVMPQPGGGVNQQFADLVSGKVPNFIPPLICLILPIILIWIPLYRSKLGISMYAIGSSKEAAFLSGVNVKLTKIKLYAIGGLFAPKGTPKEVVDKVADATRKVLANPDVQKRFAAVETDPLNLSIPAFNELLRKEAEVWSPLVRQLDLKQE